MDSLPRDIFHYLLFFVSLNDLISVVCVNKLFHNYAKDEQLWKLLLEELKSRKLAVFPRSILKPLTYFKQFKSLHLTKRLKVYRKNRYIGIIWFYPTNTLLELIQLIYQRYEELNKYGCISLEQKIQRNYEQLKTYYFNKQRLLSKYPHMQIDCVSIESFNDINVTNDLHVIAFGDHDVDFFSHMIRGKKAELRKRQQRTQQLNSLKLKFNI